MIELTESQRDELRQTEPLVIDPLTREEYVLVRREVYDRFRMVFTDDMRLDETYPAIDRAFAPGWDDPRMDDYDRYEERRP